MALTNQLDRELFRIRIILVVMIVALFSLLTIIWRLQVLNASRYRHSLESQSIRRVRLPGRRGRIYDRNGVCVANNRPSYCIAVYIEELRQPGGWSKTIDEVERVLVHLSNVLGLEKTVTREDIETHIRRRLPLPFLPWKDIGLPALARWAESGISFPGVDIYIEPVRVYPVGEYAAHVLGYVGRADPEQNPDEPYHYYLPEIAGKYGLEKEYNGELAGLAGGELIRVDASGYKHDIEGVRDPLFGGDLRLTLDMDIQKIAEGVIRGERSAVVVLDPRNGDVLAMASAPSFDSNSFSPAISPAEFRRMNRDPAKPFFDRAISGGYPPGSTFKPLVAVAALENHRATPTTALMCPGYFQLGTARFYCWKKSGHGLLMLQKAIEQSCNAYFCQLGLRTGYERIYHMADAIGFGRPTKIDLPAESSGLLPSEAWKQRVLHDAWRAGDTCNISIGQGALVVTPLQMAVFTATLANGGYVYRPRLVLQTVRSNGHGTREDGRIFEPMAPKEGELVNNMHWSAETLRVVRGGMHDVVQADSGTGKRARIPGVEMAGKTGTAEYGLKGSGKKHAWMIVFAPFENPRYAAAIVVEDAVSGGTSAAPRIKDLMQGIFDLEKDRGRNHVAGNSRGGWN